MERQSGQDRYAEAETGDPPANQPQWPEAGDLWADDPVLRDHAGAAGADARLLPQEGQRLGSAEARAAGRMAERSPPTLERFDRRGARIERVAYHPAYHQLMRDGIDRGYAGLPWQGQPGGHASHAALVYMTSQVEPGVCCPMTMTYAAGAMLTGLPDLLGGITARCYDPSDQPWHAKRGLTFGMAMTEKQGGSDVRANLTRAEPDGEGYRLWGHKWFCSAPMSDGWLTLAQLPEGLSCFLVPRFLPGGGLNQVHLLRLKDKLGNRSNASAEVEYRGAWALPIGAPGDGVRAIIPMVHHTRLDTAMAPAGLMRAALAQAVHWARGRRVFGDLLVDQPLMRRVLAELVLDWEGATALGLRVAAAYDGGAPDAGFARVGVALAKFLSNKLAPQFIYECMECLGGMGFVEDTPLPMLYREAPLNSIWEGSGNVICLDVLRTLARDSGAAQALEAELDAARGGDAGYNRALAAFRQTWRFDRVDPGDARCFVEGVAQLLTASVLLRQAPGPVAEGYVSARLSGASDRGGGPSGRAYGTAAGLQTDALLARVGEV